ncbi:MAG TPA: tetratricopeptide repeat protein [Gemmataceae bacterium]|jgi:hypothetical protein
MMTCELILAATLLAPAQADTINGTVTITTGQGTIATGQLKVGGAADRRPVDEQIEVMRALLVRRLGRGTSAPAIYSWTTEAGVESGRPGTPAGAPGYGDLSGQNMVGTLAAPGLSRWVASSHEPAVEGSYLDGYGAVFTVTLPPTDRDPRPGAEGSKAPAGLSDWDREQRQLRGEPPPEQPTRTRQGQPAGDVVLKLLADNGKHFTGLRADERVTIAVTFRGPAVHQSPPVRTATQAAAFGGPGGGPTRNPGGEDRVGTYENLGDLHLKQGEPQRAVEAYARAVEVAQADAKESDNSDRVQGALLKLSQAYLAAGKLDEARQTMDRAKAAREPRGRTNTATAKSAALPARLTISATKKLLDDVGSGKVSFDDFRKQATVEYVPAGKAAE